jgi:cytidine deaminase
VKFFGSSNASPSGECRQVVLQFNTEEIVRNQGEHRSQRELGSVSLPRALRMALSKAV